MAFNNGDLEIKQHVPKMREPPEELDTQCEQIITDRPTIDDDCPQHQCPNKATHWIPYGGCICTPCLEELKEVEIEEAADAQLLEDIKKQIAAREKKG